MSKEDLRCYTLHYFYKIINSLLFYGEDGYSTSTLERATKVPTLEEDTKISEHFKSLLANQCKVPVKNIIRISRNEYIQNVETEGKQC